MDHVRTGGTLAHLVRGYFKMDGHHVQFNVVRAETLREAQARPEDHRDLIVRVAGYSDYLCDLPAALQDEIIARTEHEGFQRPERAGPPGRSGRR